MDGLGPAVLGRPPSVPQSPSSAAIFALGFAYAPVVGPVQEMKPASSGGLIFPVSCLQPSSGFLFSVDSAPPTHILLPQLLKGSGHRVLQLLRHLLMAPSAWSSTPAGSGPPTGVFMQREGNLSWASNCLDLSPASWAGSVTALV